MKSFKIIILILTINALAAQADPIPGVAVYAPGAKSAAKKLLKDQAISLLNALNGHFSMPEFVSFVSGPGGPRFDALGGGTIEIRFPMFLENCKGRRMKQSPESSVAINLHELVHQIVDVDLRANAGNDPELLWAFRSRVDKVGSESTRLTILATKAKSRFKNKSAIWIQNHFSKINHLANRYEEFFADLVPVILSKNPDAIYDSIVPQDLKLACGLDLDMIKSYSLRRFNADQELAEIEKMFRRDEHGNFALAQTYFWREIFTKRAAAMPPGEVAKKAFAAIVSSIKDVTKDFEKTGEKADPKELNESLMKYLDQAFEK